MSEILPHCLLANLHERATRVSNPDDTGAANGNFSCRL
jgi:hypothetical protein